MKTNLQIPIDKSLRDNSARVAKEYGYSSLQDAVRMFLTQLSTRTITINITSKEPDEILTPVKEKILTKKYQRAKTEIKQKQ